MSLIQYHGEGDWCHVCGRRDCPTVDIYFPINAEHNRALLRMIRICADCAILAVRAACTRAADVQTRHPPRVRHDTTGSVGAHRTCLIGPEPS